MQELQPITVVLADDHAIVREGFVALCAANGMNVLGQCADGPTAIDMVLNLKPDFAILDLDMPMMTGVEVIRRLRAKGCTSKLMILSISRDESTVLDALRAGADAYLLKDGEARHLIAGHQLRSRRRRLRGPATPRRRPLYAHRPGTRGRSAGIPEPA